MYLRHRQNIATGNEVLDTDIRFLEVVHLDSGSFLLAATGRNGGLSSYRLDADGAVVNVAGMQSFSSNGTPAAGGMMVAVTGGTSAAITVGSYATTNAYSFTLSATGALSSATVISGTPGFQTLAAYEVANGAVFYSVSPQGGQLQRIGATSSGFLDPLSISAELPALEGVTALGIGTSGGTSFLLAADYATQGIGSYRIDATNGALSAASSIGADEGLGISLPTAFETVNAYGQTWVILGAAGSSTLSILTLSPTGALAPVDHVLDTRETRFGGVQSLDVAQVGERVFIVAGGADDGLSLLSLMPDGQLLHLGSIPHAEGAGLLNVETIELTVIGDMLQVFVSSGTDRGISRFEVDLSRLGQSIRGDMDRASTLSGGARDDLLVAGANDTLSGGSGDDILLAAPGAHLGGGAGRDIFVLAEADIGARILDFDPASDRLDLSSFAMLRSPTQVSVTSTSWGARIRIRNTEIELHRANGGRLEHGDLFGPAFTWPDRIPVYEPEETPAPSPPPDPEPEPEPPAVGFSRSGTIEADLLAGAAGDDTLSGGDGNDTLRGLAGDDAIVGGNGNDRLEGGDGNDWMTGNTGNDVLTGEAGSDSLIGGEGRDILDGGDGDDVLRGGGGDDILQSGAGDDRLYGDAGRDSLVAGEGADLAFGGDANDTVEGGGGNDTLFGDDGDDLMYGGDGDDGVWGDVGNDTLYGGAGNDTVGGFVGDDVFHTGDGSDVVWGNAGNDRGWGGAGNDTLGGGNDRDLLFGEAGNDLVWGGSGNDTLSGGTGVDTVGGFVGDDIMHGDDGDDFVWGNSGRDTLYGDAGDDLLGGGDGDDVLIGGDGDDELRGGSGDDVNTGGAGADTFYFRFRDSGFDRITDFDLGIDTIHIDVSPVAFKGLQMRQWGSDVLIDIHNGQIAVAGTLLVDLTADHFMFN